MKRIAFNLFLIFINVIVFSSAYSSVDVTNLKSIKWPFEGIFGYVDKQSAQRGFQVYREVCSSCHALNNISYRNLENIGFSKEEIKEVAKSYKVKDGPNSEGEMFERNGLPSDTFVPPFPNEKAARYANGGSYPVDLSLIIKARKSGPDYIYSILTGYINPPPSFKMQDGLHYNKYFPGNQIGMPQPLSDGLVVYQDGTNASIEQMAHDLTIFLQWAAEPEMEHRKSMGLKVTIFLILTTLIMYLAKNNIWSRLER